MNVKSDIEEAKEILEELRAIERNIELSLSENSFDKSNEWNYIKGFLSRIETIERSLSDNQTGVQNVYNKFEESIQSMEIIKKMPSSKIISISKLLEYFQLRDERKLLEDCIKRVREENNSIYKIGELRKRFIKEVNDLIGILRGV